MKNRITGPRGRLSYANVTASVALFIALGGTSYAAATLPRDSVGAKQIRTDAVGSAELRRGAVRSSDIHNNAISLNDLSPKARSALAGSPGPQGPAGTPAISEHVQVNSGGGSTGTGVVGHDGATNVYTAIFKRDVSACAYSATLAAAQNGPVFEDPPAGRITVARGGGPNVIVKTFDAAGTPTPEPFHLIVAC